MKYYLVSVNDADQKWRSRELLRDVIFDDQGRDVRRELAYGAGRWNGGRLFCELLRAGNPSPVQSAMTKRLLMVKANSRRDLGALDGQIDWLQILDRNGEVAFDLLRPANAVEAVDFDRSDIERWSAGEALRPWDDSRGRMFFRPALRHDCITNLDLFRLSDWPGPENIVASDSVKDRLLEWLGDDLVYKHLE